MRNASLILSCSAILVIVILVALIPDHVEAGKKHNLVVINNGHGKVMYDEGKKKKGKKIMMSSGGCCKKKKCCKKCKKKKKKKCGCGGYGFRRKRSAISEEDLDRMFPSCAEICGTPINWDAGSRKYFGSAGGGGGGVGRSRPQHHRRRDYFWRRQYD